MNTSTTYIAQTAAAPTYARANQSPTWAPPHGGHQTSKTSARPTSVLTELRRLIPHRGDLGHDEVRRIVDLQATRLRRLLKTTDVAEADIASLPRINVVHEPMATSGSSHWNGREWVISLNSGDSLTRQRYTLLHELGHVIWHGHNHRIRPHQQGTPREEFIERAADYFAACVLMPRRELKSAWASGLQKAAALADHFGVSPEAMRIRLDQTGLSRAVDRDPDVRPTARCARPISTPRAEPQRFVPAQRSNWSLA